MSCYHYRRFTLGLAAIALAGTAVGCQKPTAWPYTGPRVYLIQGTAGEQSDGLVALRNHLLHEEVNAALYSPDNWLQIVKDIDAKPDEEAILVGHGHGAFLCTQVVRHYAQEHKTKFIKAVFTLDPYNKDWPHKIEETCLAKSRYLPAPIPVGQNALLVRNFRQAQADAQIWGADLVGTRCTEAAPEHPFYWYDSYWTGQSIVGQHEGSDVTELGVAHETIDNNPALLQRIFQMCRLAALSPYHYTPPEHHPDVERQN